MRNNPVRDNELACDYRGRISRRCTWIEHFMSLLLSTSLRHALRLRAFRMRRPLCVVLPLVCALGLTLLGCTKEKPPATQNSGILDADDLALLGEQEVAKPASVVRFVDVSKETGLEFVHTNGASGDVLMIESTSGGAGWLDYDLDGRPDVYICQGNDPKKPIDENQPNDALFRQVDGPRFIDVAELARISERFYGQGVCVGDYNDDGFDDVFVTNAGRDTLWRNMGDGTFLDVTEEAGVTDDRWSSSAAFADVNGDGALDLYVCHYCDYDMFNPIICRDEMGRRRTCHPKDVPASYDEFFINLGDGTFREESKARGLFGPGNKSLGVLIADFDQDGDLDIYVANDTTDNFYFENDGKGQFRELAQRKGCAVNRNGIRQASMGLAFGDYDGDGWQDFYSTHFYSDSNTLYRNLGGKRGFEDVTAFVQLHEPTLPFLGFGSLMHDFDHDGAMELIVANGHVDSEIGESLYRMTGQLFTYHEGVWKELSASAGPAFQERVVGRGLTSADYDDDGDLDVLQVNQNSPVFLLRNDSPRGRWLHCEFRGRETNRRGIGCRVEVETASGRKFVGELCGGSTYASSIAPCLNFGLGDEPGPLKVRVLWPSGKVQTLDAVKPDQKLLFREEEAQASSADKVTAR